MTMTKIDFSANTNVIRTAIENVLQDLMFASMHVTSPHTATSLEMMLAPLQSQKKRQCGDQVLFTMYNPILWRALSVTNPLVEFTQAQFLPKHFPSMLSIPLEMSVLLFSYAIDLNVIPKDLQMDWNSEN